MNDLHEFMQIPELTHGCLNGLTHATFTYGERSWSSSPGQLALRTQQLQRTI